jgi:predicted SAM-dependent methyltransferase
VRSLPEFVQAWHKYTARYGVVHALARFIGARIPSAWDLVGPIVTRHYRLAWLSASGRKIINLGGGGNCLDGCLTADIYPRADTFVDCRKALPFANASIDGIFCEEMIEHISKLDALRLLQECWRILKPGGVIRITTPDLDWFCGSLLKGAIDCDVINSIFFNHQHVYLYSRLQLHASLRISGFIDIRQSSFRDPAAALGYLDSHALRFGHTPDLSQYVEARRPIEISVNEENLCDQEQPKRRATPIFPTAGS